MENKIKLFKFFFVLYLHEILFELCTMYAHYMNTKKYAIAMYRFRNQVESKAIFSQNTYISKQTGQAISQKNFFEFSIICILEWLDQHRNLGKPWVHDLLNRSMEIVFQKIQKWGI